MNNIKELESLFNKDLLQSFDLIEGIPWAYSDGKKSFLDWSTKVQAYFKYEEDQLAHLQNLLNQNSINEISKTRVQQFIQDKHSHLKQMRKILNPFLKNEAKNIIIDNQSILSYQTNIFRDWVWGKEENKIYANYIKSHIDSAVENILVLGAGSCGLSYELARSLKANIISVDINPYLFLVAQKLFNKKHLKLYEFVDNAAKEEYVSIKTEIKPPEQVNNHFQVFCDFFNLPFKENTFDAVIACWFYDILDPSLNSCLEHINYYLKDHAESFFIGPSSFHKKEIEQKLTTSEIVSTFESKYSEVQSFTENVTYLDNPNNTYKRSENILFLKAKNKTSSRLFTKENESSDFVQLTPALSAYKQQNEVFYRILKHIERPMTINALAREVQKEFGFSEEEAKFYTENFIKKLNFEIN